MIPESPYTNSVFEEPWWLDIAAPGEWDEIVIKDEDRIVARFPYCYQSGRISNPRYTQTLGIWIDASLRMFSKGNSNIHKQKEILFELIDKLPKSKVVSLYLDSSNSYILPFRWKGFDIEPTFSYRISFSESEDYKSALFGKTVIKNIKAASRGIIIEDDSTDYNSLIDLQNRTYARQNRKNPVDNDFTLEVMKKAHDCGHGRLMVARDSGGHPHSAGFFLYDSRGCYYLLGGQDPEFKSDGSQNLLLDAAISFSKNESKYFDFEGSMVEGIENFFRQFGGKQIINYHVSKQKLIFDLIDIMKPRIKRVLGYKI